MNSKLSNILKSGLAALVLLLSSGALKAQDAYLTNFTDCNMIAEVSAVSNCVNCTTITVGVPAMTTIPMPVPTGCVGPTKVKVVPAICASSGSAEVITEKCLCNTGTITDHDCFTMTTDCCEDTGTIIVVGAQCYLDDMYVTITKQTSCP